MMRDGKARAALDPRAASVESSGPVRPLGALSLSRPAVPPTVPSGDTASETGAAAAALAAAGERLFQAGEHAQAADHLQRALEGYDRAGITDGRMVGGLSTLAAIYIAQGLSDRARPLLEEALALGERLLGRDHPDLAPFLNNLAQLQVASREFDAAETLLRRLFAIKAATLGEDHPEAAGVLATLATVYEGAGHVAAAQELWRQVLVIREATLPPDAPAIAVTLEHLAGTCATAGNPREALVLLERALAIRERTLGPDHPSLAVVRAKQVGLRLEALSTPGGTPGAAPAAPSDAAAPATPARRASASGAPARPRTPAAPRVTSGAGARIVLHGTGTILPRGPGGGVGTAPAAVSASDSRAMDRPQALTGGRPSSDETPTLEDEFGRDEEREAEQLHQEGRSRFDPLGDAVWPITRLVLGGAFVLGVAIAGLVVTRTGGPRPDRRSDATRAPSALSVRVAPTRILGTTPTAGPPTGLAEGRSTVVAGSGSVTGVVRGAAAVSGGPGVRPGGRAERPASRSLQGPLDWTSTAAGDLARPGESDTALRAGAQPGRAGRTGGALTAPDASAAVPSTRLSKEALQRIDRMSQRRLDSLGRPETPPSTFTPKRVRVTSP